MLSLFSAMSPEGTHTPIKEGVKKFLLLTSYQGTNTVYLNKPSLYHLANYIQVKDMGASRLLERIMAIMLYRSLLAEGSGVVTAHDLAALTAVDQLRFEQPKLGYKFEELINRFIGLTPVNVY